MVLSQNGPNPRAQWSPASMKRLNMLVSLFEFDAWKPTFQTALNDVYKYNGQPRLVAEPTDEERGPSSQPAV